MKICICPWARDKMRNSLESLRRNRVLSRLETSEIFTSRLYIMLNFTIIFANNNPPDFSHLSKIRCSNFK